MDSQLPFPPEIWERIPPEAQAYIRVLESRVAALEATVQQLREQVQQTSRTSSRPPVERSATGDRHTSAPRAQWASTGWAAWS